MKTLTPYKDVLLFAGLTYGFSWLCWIPVALSRQNAINSGFVLLYALGGFGPSLAGLFLARRAGGRDGLRALLRRALELRFPGRWWALILLIWPVLFGLAALIASLAGTSPYPYSPLGKLIEAQPLVLIPQGLITLLGGPLSEEYGWRGYALDRLQDKMGSLRASLLLGLAWGLWHLPLFFMVGTAQSNLSAALFLLNILALAVLFTWVYNGTGRSLGAAVLLHFGFNFVSGFVPLLDTLTFGALAGLSALAAIGVGVRWVRKG